MRLKSRGLLVDPAGEVLLRLRPLRLAVKAGMTGSVGSSERSSGTDNSGKFLMECELWRTSLLSSYSELAVPTGQTKLCQ